ncbi:MAG: ATP synthase F1 subunit epsilon [Treponema sp.]|jgi:F-type H+-transporting ATPase subunit epsilon|nr:ATP synthase F1 subunit epsilon [Treponema sp.]
MPVLFTFEVYTPYRLFFSGSVEAVFLTLSDGEIGVYANHSPFTAPVKAGFLKVRDKEGKTLEAFVTEGILEVKNHRVVLIVDAAEWPDEIDYDRAAADKKRAEENLKSSMFKFETDTILAALRRAEYRIKLAEKKRLL